MSEAAMQVFGLPELCEAIMLQIPIKDLFLRAQLVCTIWRDNIAASARCQQALFLEPVPGKPLRYVPTKGREPFRWAVDENDNLAYTVCKNPFTTKLELMPGFWSQAIMRPEASWRNMFLCQPPVLDC